MTSEYEKLLMEKEKLEAEFGQIVEGQDRALQDNREDVIHDSEKRKDEIRNKLGKINKQLDDIHGS